MDNLFEIWESVANGERSRSQTRLCKSYNGDVKGLWHFLKIEFTYFIYIVDMRKNIIGYIKIIPLSLSAFSFFFLFLLTEMVPTESCVTHFNSRN